MAAPTETEICNLALLKVGTAGGFITSLETDNSAQAVACNLAFKPCRDEILQPFPWSFAVRRAVLAADTVAPAWGYATAFILPADFLAMVAVENQRSEFTVEYGRLLSDESAPLYIRYTAQVQDTSRFSPTFVQALAARIALEICPALAVSNTKTDLLAGLYKRALALAKLADRQNMSDPEPNDGSWNDARL